MKDKFNKEYNIEKTCLDISYWHNDVHKICDMWSEVFAYSNEKVDPSYVLWVIEAIRKGNAPEERDFKPREFPKERLQQIKNR